MLRASAALLLAMVLLSPRAVQADDMSIALSRLRTEQSAGAFQADNDAFTRLVSQLGFALAAPNLAPARTTGYRGFYIGFETSVVGIDSGAEYWALGTEGDAMSTGRNRFVASALTSSRLALRKGLPYGLEIGASLGRFYNTDSWIWGGELRIALLEGFREGAMGFIPDLAVRGAVRTLSGESELHITVPSFDIIASKPIVLGGAVVFTPIVAAQLMWIVADSELVDLTPDIDAFAMCGVAPGQPQVGDRSNIQCTGGAGSTQDLGNNQVFNDVRAFRARMSIGAELRYRVFTFNAAIHWDLKAPGDIDADVPDDLPRQWDFSVGLGATY